MSHRPPFDRRYDGRLSIRRAWALRDLAAVLAVALLAVLLPTYWPRRGGPPPPQPPPPTVEQIRELADLVLIRVDVADIVQSRLEGWTGSAQANALVRGQTLIGTDLGACRLLTCDPQTRRAVLALPAPRPLCVAVDYAESSFEPVSYWGLWAVTGGDAAERYLAADRHRRAQKLLASVAAQPRWAAQAKARAEQVLAGFVEGLGWALEVRWVEPGSGPAGLD